MRVVLLALLTATVALAGCFGEDLGSDDDDGTPTGSPTHSAGATETPGAGTGGEKRSPVTWEVVMDEVAFQDSPAVIQAGDTVRWVHEDGTTLHRVETRDGAPESFDSGDMTAASDSEFSYTFETTGQYPYFCRYHEGVMSESIEVREEYSGTPGDIPDGPDEPQEPPEGNGTQNDTGPMRPPVTWPVTIAGTAFVDGTLTVQQGDTVEWVHEDGATPHTVTADDGAFDSGPVYLVGVPILDTFSYTFEELGEFRYFCEVHPSMRGTVTVAERYDPVP